MISKRFEQCDARLDFKLQRLSIYAESNRHGTGSLNFFRVGFLQFSGDGFNLSGGGCGCSCAKGFEEGAPRDGKIVLQFEVAHIW